MTDMDSAELSTDRWSDPDRLHRVRLAALVIRSRRIDPCAERVRQAVMAELTPDQLAAIPEAQADALAKVLDAVLDGLDLSDERREMAHSIASTHLRRMVTEVGP